MNRQPPPEDPLAAEEPLFDPEDTPPTGVRPAVKTPARGIRRADASAPRTNPRLIMRRPSGWLNGALLAGAVLMTALAAVLYLQEPSSGVPQAEVAALPTESPADVPTAMPTNTPPPTPIPPSPVPVDTLDTLADQTVPPDVIAELLQAPGYTAPPLDGFYRMHTAFTVAPARSRASVVQYRIQPGDTLDRIAERFGLATDTLVWNNDGIYVNRLQVGDTLTILPENGVLHRTVGEETIQSIADRYQVSPYIIIDSEYNTVLRNASPSTLLPPGVEVMVPGGTGTRQAVYWNPGIQVSGGSGGSGATTASFGGGPGSCGPQQVVGGSGSLAVPLPPVYVYIRGFTPYHTGIDLSAPTGTTVFAADGGTVIFAGWSNWGYGYTVVIAHGRLMTLYGHMSQVSVSCGQVVNRGTPIGAVGNTGNSSGPHLHFEVRVGEVPDNPENYLAF